mmetsp:Transcript_26001/g.39291  ORF Transcript_26001/g.39291 Transcript_26001/m.39291 type:complete len:96 (-) Transcript_26001:69-356(-)
MESYVCVYNFIFGDNQRRREGREREREREEENGVVVFVFFLLSFWVTILERKEKKKILLLPFFLLFLSIVSIHLFVVRCSLGTSRIVGNNNLACC